MRLNEKISFTTVKRPIKINKHIKKRKNTRKGAI